MILITGVAGFIGFHLAKRLLLAGYKVQGVDSLTPYYDIELKKSRLEQLASYKSFNYQQLDIADRKGVEALFNAHAFDIVVNLAAQAGVRYSLENPHSYIDSNIAGFLNILEGCRHLDSLKHLVFASSSSVYGANTVVPFSTEHAVDHPISLYAATKKSNELMAHAYSHLYRIPVTGLRFFTVYGEWGRPDMAYFLFTKAIMENAPINVFNNGKMQRDFTYIDDIVEGITRVMDKPATANPAWCSSAPQPSSSDAPYKIYNIGNNQPVELLYMIETLEKLLGKTAQKNFLPMQQGDVVSTHADIDDLHQAIGFSPSTSIEEGLARFVAWYRGYYLDSL
jgi:UDP-glucuronate 4-epimerase